MPTTSITLDSNLAEVLRALEVLPRGIQLAARSGLQQGLGVLRGAVQRNITSTFRTTSKGGLRQSVVGELQEFEGLEGRLAVEKEYAAIHEFGGTILPKNAKALTVPIAPEAMGKRAADFPGLKLIPRKGKPPLLALEVTGRSVRVRQFASDLATKRGLYGTRPGRGPVRAIIPLFVLMKSVTLPARPYFFPAIEKNLDKVPKLIRQQLDAYIKWQTGPLPGGLAS